MACRWDPARWSNLSARLLGRVAREAMTSWYELYDQHRAARTIPKDLIGMLRRRLVALADRGHCALTIQGRFSYQDHGKLRLLRIGSDDAGESLSNLPFLIEARLTVLALVSRRLDHLHQFTAMIEGLT